MRARELHPLCSRWRTKATATAAASTTAVVKVSQVLLNSNVHGRRHMSLYTQVAPSFRNEVDDEDLEREDEYDSWKPCKMFKSSVQF
ncbi:hypothetical protein Trydic_g11223 [Trypoxylus dichotomus]